jgi:hypothetical protein
MYQRKYITALRKAAKGLYPDVKKVSHVLPRAYCVAKPADHFAVFAVPPQDRPSFLRHDVFVTVQGSTAAAVCHGDWCSLAYVQTGNQGGMHVLPSIQCR